MINNYLNLSEHIYYALGAAAMVFSFCRWMWKREQFVDKMYSNHLPHVEKYLKMLCMKAEIPYIDMDE